MIRNHKEPFEPTIHEGAERCNFSLSAQLFRGIEYRQIDQAASVNPRLPLRPHLETRFSLRGNEIPALVNLRNQPTLMVCSCMDEEFARERNR